MNEIAQKPRRFQILKLEMRIAPSAAGLATSISGTAELPAPDSQTIPESIEPGHDDGGPQSPPVRSS